MPGLPAFVVHRHVPSVAGRLARAGAPRGPRRRRPARRRSGSTSGPRAASRSVACRSGSASPVARGAPVGEQAQRRREVAAVRRSARRSSAAGAPGTASRARCRPARDDAGGRSGCSGRCRAGLADSSPNRRGPSSSAPTTSRLQRSPTRSSACSSAVGVAALGGGSVAAIAAMVRRVGRLHSRRWSVVTCNPQVTHRPTTTESPHHVRPRRSRRRPSPSSPTTVGPSVVGIGRHARGSGVVIADGQVLTNAHNLRGDRSPSRSPTAAPSRAASPPSTATATSPSSRSTRPAPAPIDLAGRRRTSASARPVFGAAATAQRRRRASRSASCRPSAQAFRGPGGRRIAGSVEHTAPLAPGSSGSALVDADGRLHRPQHQPPRRGLLPGHPGRCRAARAGSRRSVVARRPSRLRLGVAIAPDHVARRLRRSVGLAERAGVLVRGLTRTALAAAAGIEAGDLIVSAGGRPVADGDDLFEALGSADDPVRARPRARRGRADRDHRRQRRRVGPPATPDPAGRARRPIAGASIGAWSGSSPGTASARRSGRSSPCSWPTPSRSSACCSSAGTCGRSSSCTGSRTASSASSTS